MSNRTYSLKNSQSRDDISSQISSRFFDSAAGITIIRLLAGEFFVTNNANEMMMTVLGSCVSTCLYDSDTGLSGMNHFMLPSNETSRVSTRPFDCRYGTHAMEVLVNEMLRGGARRERLQAKLFGGAMLGVGSSAVGRTNAQFAEEYLEREGISLVAKDLLGDAPRRVHMHPATGKVMVKTMSIGNVRDIVRGETTYSETIDRKIKTNPSEVELFDD